jgi:hypothetical protein
MRKILKKHLIVSGLLMIALVLSACNKQDPAVANMLKQVEVMCDQRGCSKQDREYHRDLALGYYESGMSRTNSPEKDKEDIIRQAIDFLKGYHTSSPVYDSIPNQ